MGKDVLYQVPIFHLAALTQTPIREIISPDITVRIIVTLDLDAIPCHEAPSLWTVGFHLPAPKE